MERNGDAISMKNPMPGTILSLLMLAGILLSGGGLYVWIKLKNAKQGALMLVAALVMFANVAIWAVPIS
jgi:hypothetical protein